MKPLALILLLACVSLAQGQGMSDSSTIEQDFSWLEQQHEQELRGIASSFVELWDRYKAECYADSTEQWESGYCDRPGCAVMHGHMIVTHRTPTLDGFIEYLRKEFK